MEIAPPDNAPKHIAHGISALDEVLAAIKDAQNKIENEKPDRIITIGGNCIVSLAPFDYLHGRYKNTGIVWIDAHPDISTVNDGYPYAHAMALGSLMGYGAAALSGQMKNDRFKPDDILYVGLQKLHGYQERFLNNAGVQYKAQGDSFVSDTEIKTFTQRFDHILLHFDIDVLDERFFHSTYFANPHLAGDGSDGGKMTIEKLSAMLKLIAGNSSVAGFTIAEYLPFDAFRLHNVFSEIPLFTEQ